MKLGFVLFDYFPFGGLQRDCLRIASLCAAAGHEVTFFTRSWQGELPGNMQVNSSDVTASPSPRATAISSASLPKRSRVTRSTV